MRAFLRNNGLSLVFVALFLLAMAGQFFTGFSEHNKELQEEGRKALTKMEYVQSGHFIESTFENWESEFLQMALFVVLTISLRQKGSSESKSMDGEDEVDREPKPGTKGAPWPVRKGGFILKLYKNSLTIALLVLFLLSFILHFYGSFKDENEQLVFHGKPAESAGHFLLGSRFWFESFQNWQSEFLSVFAIVILSVFLRQQGSSQSKPVDAAHGKTGG